MPTLFLPQASSPTTNPVNSKTYFLPTRHHYHPHLDYYNSLLPHPWLSAILHCIPTTAATAMLMKRYLAIPLCRSGFLVTQNKVIYRYFMIWPWLTLMLSLMFCHHTDWPTQDTRICFGTAIHTPSQDLCTCWSLWGNAFAQTLAY